MASFLTNHGAYLLNTGSVSWTGDTLKVALLTSSASPAKTDDFISTQAGSNECSVTGYIGGFGGSGRKSLGSKTATEDDTNNRVVLDAADSSWTALAAGNTLRYAAIIKEITNDAASPVIGYLDFGSNFTTNGGDLNLQWNAAGLFDLNT